VRLRPMRTRRPPVQCSALSLHGALPISLARNVRAGRPMGIAGLPEIAKGAAFSTVAGMLIYPQVCAQEYAEPRNSRRLTGTDGRSEEHTSELQSRDNLVCRLPLEKKRLRGICQDPTQRLCDRMIAVIPEVAQLRKH